MLAKAFIGFAMGAAGTDTTIETADMALMEDDLRKLPHFIQLNRDTFRVLRQNIALAIGIKAVFFHPGSQERPRSGWLFSPIWELL